MKRALKYEGFKRFQPLCYGTYLVWDFSRTLFMKLENYQPDHFTVGNGRTREV